VGKHEEKRQLGRPRSRWEDNIKMDFQGWGIDWIELAQDRDRWRALVNAAMNPRFPLNAGNFLTSCNPVSFSRRALLHGVSIHVKCLTMEGCKIEGRAGRKNILKDSKQRINNIKI